MSWWTRSPTRPRARARLRAASGSVSRKLPPTIQKTSIAPAAGGVDHLRRGRGPCGRGPGSPRPRASASPCPAPPGRARSPTSAPPWTPECPRIGIRPRVRAPGQPRARPTLTRARIVSHAVRVLGQAHRPDEDARWARDEQLREVAHLGARRAAVPLELLPGLRLARAPRPPRSRPCELATNPGRSRRGLEQRLEDAVQEGEVAAGVHLEPVVGERVPKSALSGTEGTQ